MLRNNITRIDFRLNIDPDGMLRSVISVWQIDQKLYQWINLCRIFRYVCSGWLSWHTGNTHTNKYSPSISIVVISSKAIFFLLFLFFSVCKKEFQKCLSVQFFFSRFFIFKWIEFSGLFNVRIILHNFSLTFASSKSLGVDDGPNLMNSIINLLKMQISTTRMAAIRRTCWRICYEPKINKKFLLGNWWKKRAQLFQQTVSIPSNV